MYHKETNLVHAIFGTRQSRIIAVSITFLTTLLTLTLLFYLTITPSTAFEDDVEAYHISTPGPLDGVWRSFGSDSVDKFRGWFGIDGRDRYAEALQLRELRSTFDQRYPADPLRPARSLNGPALERLAHCIEYNSCGQGEETVVLLASFHFINAQQGRTGGEDIWARSTIEAFTSLNYTLLYTVGPMDTLTLYQGLSERVRLVVWEGTELKSCLKRNESNWKDLELDHTPGKWQKAIDTQIQKDKKETGEKSARSGFGCIKKDGFEAGIPLRKSFTFHFWEGSENPLGHDFTLAPEDFSQWSKDGTGNRYLGYSIESRCKAIELPAARQHRGMILGKRAQYLNATLKDWMWRSDHSLDKLITSMPSGTDENGEEVEFEMIATGGTTKEGVPEVLYDGPIRNLGTMQQDLWFQTLAESKFLLGAGKPALSPSPFDALCFGVPFINPITWFDQKDPDNWTLWQTQHNGLRGIAAPYVYNVQKGNMEQLDRAMRDAVANPIGRYIPPQMTREAVMERHRVLVETDWTEEAERAVDVLYTAKGRDFPWHL
ncbi:hypothetical protein IAU59_000471 [Kwoniella sp. CBS 9459]